MCDSEPEQSSRIQLQEKLVRSIEGAVNACEYYLRRCGSDDDNRRYMQELLDKMQADLAYQSERLDGIRRLQIRGVDK